MGTIEDYTPAAIRQYYRQSIKLLAQDGAASKTILVWAASNDHGYDCLSGPRCVNGKHQASSPSLWAGLPAKITELRGHSLAVVSTDRNGIIADSSNRCGIAADWCIAAPGEKVRIAYYGPQGRGWGTGSGTSFAAPMVSGGLAIMKQIFRGQLTNTQLVTRLLQTANDEGRYSDSSIYGHGLMDLDAATNPWGETGFMRTGQLVGSRADAISTVNTGLHSSSAIGDGFAQALAGREVVAFDDLGAPFWYAAASFVQPPPSEKTTVSLNRLFARTGNTRLKGSEWSLGGRQGRPAMDMAHLALTNNMDHVDLPITDDWSVSYFNRPQSAAGSQISGMTAIYSPVDLPTVSVQAGWMAEQNSLLGGSATGAFGRLAGHTNFLALGLKTDGPAGWQLSTKGEWGLVRPDTSDGLLLKSLSTLHTNAYRVAAQRQLTDGGLLQIAIEQPLRVAKGTAHFDLPTGRTTNGRVTSESMSVGVVPTGRQLDLSARLDHPVPGGTLILEGVMSRQPSHQARAPTTWTVLMGWQTLF